jgi:Tfp pilus assembly protein FimT
MIVLEALLHLIYFMAAVVAIFFASLAIGRFFEVKANRFKARRELARMRAVKARASQECTAAVERTRDWQWPRRQPPAEYTVPAGKTRVGIREAGE